MLQGLRGDGDTDAERVRRRESAEEARRNRRMRRRAAATSVSKDNVDGTALSPVKETASPTKANIDETDELSPVGSSMGRGKSITSASPAIIISSTADGVE
jgi:cytokinesis protein